MKTYENVKYDVNARIKIKKPRFFPCLVIWRRLDNLQIKQTSNHILNAVKYCVKTATSRYDTVKLTSDSYQF